MTMSKENLRNLLKRTIRSMTTGDKKTQSNLIFEQVMSHRVIMQKSSKAAICFYLSTSDEVDTWRLLNKFISERKPCYVPVVLNDTDMEMVRVTDINDMTVNQWGIREPRLKTAHTRWDESDIVVFVPGLGFTVDGKRIGRGKGYYDRWIKRVRTRGLSPYLVGLSFKQQLLQNIPTDDSDEMLNEVIYPNL